MTMVDPTPVSEPVPTPQAKQQATLLLLQMLRPCVEQLSALTAAMAHAFAEFDERIAECDRAEMMGATELRGTLPDLREHLRERRFTDQEEYVYIVEPYIRSVRNGSREWTIRTLAQYLRCNRSVVHRALLRYRKGPGRAVWARDVAPKLLQYSRGPLPDPLESKPPKNGYGDPKYGAGHIPVGAPKPSKPTRAAIRDAREAAERLPQPAKKRRLEELAFDDTELYGDAPNEDQTE